MNQREAARRRRVIEETLMGLAEILNTNLWQELDPDQETILKDLLELGMLKMGVQR